MFISGATAADVYLVMARTGEQGPKGISAFVVDKVGRGCWPGVVQRLLLHGCYFAWLLLCDQLDACDPTHHSTTAPLTYQLPDCTQ